MTKIYTPEQWHQFFRCASIIIEDDGRIFSADDYYSTFRSPIGKVDYSKNFIYGEDYSSMFATPIARIVDHGDEKRVYEYGGSLLSAPILYIKNNKIYTPEEYFRWFGGEASGYIEEDKPHDRDDHSGSRDTTESASGHSGMPIPGVAMVIGTAILIGIIWLLTSETRIANASSVIALAVNAFVLGRIVLKSLKGELRFAWNGKNFAKGLFIGIGVYVAATALFTLLGIGSNIGTKGNPLSDEAGNQMELSAMFIGLPFVINSLFVDKSGK